jgi:hypothetical protein
MNNDKIEKVFVAIESAALAGERCPVNGKFGVTSLNYEQQAVHELCRAGRIKSEIYGFNYRVIEITAGPNKGKRTKENPKVNAKPYKVVGVETTRHDRNARWYQPKVAI